MIVKMENQLSTSNEGRNKKARFSRKFKFYDFDGNSNFIILTKTPILKF